jgi:hypothetical protein
MLKNGRKTYLKESSEFWRIRKQDWKSVILTEIHIYVLCKLYIMRTLQYASGPLV